MPVTTEDLRGLRVAALVDDRFEEVELAGSQSALEEAGARVDIISRHSQLTAMRHFAPGSSCKPDVRLHDAQPDHYDALLLPGGVINGDSLRVVPEAQRFAQAMARAHKPMAVICHGGWLLISSQLVKGRTLTSWPTLQDDYQNAGAHWVDQEVVVDENWVSSRKPDDIPAFNRALNRVLAQLRRRKAA